MISLYSPEKKLTVYCSDCWWGDGWDGRDFGREFDFSRGFFEQFYELQCATPRLGLLNTRAENSAYCSNTIGNKNCYLLFGGDFNEDSFYSIFSFHCKDASDLLWVTHSELCYDCVDCREGYNLRYCQGAHGCRDSAFLFDCRNVSQCFGCVGLRNKEYHIFNKPYSKKDYEKKVASFRLDTWSGVQHMKREFAAFKLNFPHRAAVIVNSENCTGDFIENSRNSVNCFDVFEGIEDVRDAICVGGLKDSLSLSHGGYQSELLYEMMSVAGGYQCAFGTYVWYAREAYYCDTVLHSKSLFGCTNLKRAEFCLLNKPYSESEYTALKARVILHMKKTGEWGLFFPMGKSLFAYDETAANDFFPLSKSEALKRGLLWRDEELHGEGTGATIPDSIHDVTDDLVGQRLVCERTCRPYKLVSQELKLYHRLTVPVPRFASETRHRLRLDQRNPRHLWTRSCTKCDATIQTVYAPERPEQVVCEACYLAARY